jgi:SPP1 family predicted phage head-tail adaptor
MLPYQIDPGTLRHKIQIQQASAAGDSRGRSVTPASWTTVLETRASIEGTNSRTFRMSFQNSTQVSRSTDCITIRWPGAAVDVKTGMRVLFGDNTFNIDAVDNVQRRNRKVVLACTQISSDSN